MFIIEILKVIVLGLVEGFSEWLPISSTGHMILVNEIIDLNVSAAFKSVFLVVIQLGAILAVCVTYMEKLNPFSKRKKANMRKATIELWFKIIIASLPAAILGFLLDDWLDAHFYNGFVVALMLILYGIVFIVVENKKKYELSRLDSVYRLDYQTALYIGIFQVLALIPGTSRSGATIIGALMLGCSRLVATEFSFFLGLPIMLGASFLKLVKYGFAFSFIEIIYLIVGMGVSFIVSAIFIRFLLDWVKRHDFIPFGIYRIVLGIIVLLWFSVRALLKV